MSDLSAYASTRDVRLSTSATFTSSRVAAAAAGFMLREPTSLPNGLRAVSYTVNSPSGQLVTFAAHRKTPNSSLAALPADIAGSTLRVDIGSTVVALYQTAATAADEARVTQAIQRMNAQAASERRSAPSIPAQTGPLAGRAARMVKGQIVAQNVARVQQPHVTFNIMSTRRGGHAFGFHVAHGAPAGLAGTMPLVVVQMPVPQIASTGVSVQRIVSYMLSAPGVPPRVAAAFGALGDISTTLPIPVPIDRAFTQPVIVDGVSGVGIGDNTGLGASVIWQKNGMLYAVCATQPAQTVLAIANSLR
jgi:hypothetical protein